MFFSKYSANGNDFIITHFFSKQSFNFSELAKQICHRFKGVGADGLIILKPHSELDFEWEFYNCDGSVATMCGNGSRAAAKYANDLKIAGERQRFLTLAGIIQAEISENLVESALSGVEVLRQDIKELGQTWDLIDTGVPHLVCESGAKITKEDLRALRHKYNANINVVTLENNFVRIRTFERGVEDETLACGTGMAASFYYLLQQNKIKNPYKFIPASGDEIFLKFENNKLFLKGEVRKICDFVYKI
ncbi:MAG: diaminopimelate epimerase [Helicobacter sp.]|nr:diaminopimelate epimerase [Helicobacteraceae bacterium]MDY3113057.1 diaminopimelate epimerase [Helicobacter sp.]